MISRHFHPCPWRVTYPASSLLYFFSKIVDLCEPSYVPTQQDILHAQVHTTGINKLEINLGGNDLEIIDVGGRRTERTKWSFIFPDVHCAIFVVNLSAYDCLAEDGETVNLVPAGSLPPLTWSQNLERHARNIEHLAVSKRQRVVPARTCGKLALAFLRP